MNGAKVIYGLSVYRDIESAKQGQLSCHCAVIENVIVLVRCMSAIILIILMLLCGKMGIGGSRGGGPGGPDPPFFF